jgi:hypothetical protein
MIDTLLNVRVSPAEKWYLYMFTPLNVEWFEKAHTRTSDSNGCTYFIHLPACRVCLEAQVDVSKPSLEVAYISFLFV